MEILREIDEAFTLDPSIDEIGLLFDRSSPHTLLVDHKLGIATKSLKPLFKYVSGELWRLLVDYEKALSSSHDEVHRLTRAMLIVRGDSPRALHLRKDLLDRHHLPLDAEIPLLDMIFILHPKSPSCWEHRRWILNRIYSPRLPPSVVGRELELCSRMADRYPRNYYAWIHRIWLLGQSDCAAKTAERSFVREWIRLHPSDHSAVSYQQLLIAEDTPRDTEAVAVWETIKDEISANRELLSNYAEHETLWLQRRSLMLIYLPLIADSQASEDRLMTSLEKFLKAIRSVEVVDASSAESEYHSPPVLVDLLHNELSLCTSQISSEVDGIRRLNITRCCLRYITFLFKHVTLANSLCVT